MHVFAGETPADPLSQLSAQWGGVNAEVEPKLQLTRQARDMGFYVT
jgi:hypothetical protein